MLWRAAKPAVALAQANTIHPDKDGGGREKYLLFMPPDEGSDQDNEFYQVLVRRINSKTVMFVTAYGISQKVYDEYKRVGPRIYPPPAPKKSKRSK